MYNCSSIMAVYLIECQMCGKQYTESPKTKYRSRANKSIQKYAVKVYEQKDSSNGRPKTRALSWALLFSIEDWVITFIE